MGQKLIDKAIEHYGKENQIMVAIEEMSELIKELSKDYRKIGSVENIVEEMADVYIMLEQLQVIFGIADYEINNMIICKMSRLEERIKEDLANDK